jgi:hypothetical protein
MSTEVTLRHKDVTLLEVLDRVLDKGVVIAGDLTISVADIDLVYLGLRVLLCSVETMNNMRRPVIEDDATIYDALRYVEAAGQNANEVS